MMQTMGILENVSLPCCIPEEETIGVEGNSQLCIPIKHNTTVPVFSEIALPKEETGQGQSELCISMNNNYTTTLPGILVTGSI